MRARFPTPFLALLLLLQVSNLLFAGNPSDHFRKQSFNVKKFGARGDNKTDDTRAIQMAINKAVSNGGGIITFPAGVYRISGPVIDSVGNQSCHAQLYIPFSDIEHAKNLIFQGESAPEFEAQGLIPAGPSNSGVVLLSTILSHDSTAAVIGMVKGTGKSWKQWNYTTPYFSDLGIRTTTTIDTAQIINSLGGINLRFASKCSLDNILIDTGTPLSRSLNPKAGGSVALVTPGVDNHAMVEIGLIRIGGYACGIRFSEHFVAKDVQVLCCNVGVISEFSHHSSSIQTLEIECCRYPVVFNPGHNLFVADYNTEHFTGNAWFRFEQDFTFTGKSYYPAKVVIGLCHPVVSNIGYDLSHFKTNAPERVILLEKIGSNPVK
ncbi:MAG: glycosyl hydrolase family 28-related protein [Prolixibacteraceae bacterium]